MQSTASSTSSPRMPGTPFEVVPGISGRPLRVYAAVRRSLLGDAGSAARGYRSDRGHPRAGRHRVGRQCSQRRHQHHHQGCQGHLSKSFQVLVDGRSVYTRLFAGVYWEMQDLLLEDIDRIEVILGPGGTVWGANAVNGVINIITKDARDTFRSRSRY